MSIKKMLKKIMPATYFKVDEEGQRVIDELKKENERLRKEMVNFSNVLKKLQLSLDGFQVNISNEEIKFRDVFVTKSEKTNDLLINQHQNLIKLLEYSTNEVKELVELKHCEFITKSEKTNDLLINQYQLFEIFNNMQQTKWVDFEAKQLLMKRTLDEIVWAHVFNNAISDSSWLDECSLCPGRWAMGYVELYILYRTLNEFNPKSILELGLGQSTRMIAQYAKMDKNILHKVVENDSDWIDFIRKNYDFAINTDIIQLDNEMISYNGIENVRVYKDFKEQMGIHKYDLIVVDAPLGSDMKHYSRIDILSILPECLEKSFVIILDDAERSGERGTIREIDETLTQNGIEFKRNIYHGNKDVCIWTSMDWGFLCSM